MFDNAIEYLEDVKAANSEILEAWVTQIRATEVIRDHVREMMLLDEYRVIRLTQTAKHWVVATIQAHTFSSYALTSRPRWSP